MVSLGIFLRGWSLAIGILGVYAFAGVFADPMSVYIPALTLIALAGTIVESLPLKYVDNITVALTAVVLGHLLL